MSTTTNTVKHTPLLPCPFCGSDAYAKVGPYQFPPDHEGGAWTWGYSVVCDASGFEGSEKGCGSSSAWGETPDEAVSAWNRRSPAPQEKGGE